MIVVGGGLRLVLALVLVFLLRFWCFRCGGVVLVGCFRSLWLPLGFAFHHLLKVVLSEKNVVLNHTQAADVLDDLHHDSVFGVTQVDLVFWVEVAHHACKATMERRQGLLPYVVT